MKYFVGVLFALFILSRCDGRSEECIQASKSWEDGKRMYANAKESWEKELWAKETTDRFLLKSERCK